MEMKCEDCGTKISDKVKSFSEQKHGRPLCMDCQKQASAEKDKAQAEGKQQPQQSQQKATPQKSKSDIQGVSSKNIIQLKQKDGPSKDFITHDGLMELANSQGLQSIETSLIAHGETTIFKASVRMSNGHYEAHGDANQKNVNNSILPHLIRMAETRAVNRALRFATACGMCSIEEMGGNNGNDNIKVEEEAVQ